jgi:hypothetical protein
MQVACKICRAEVGGAPTCRRWLGIPDYEKIATRLKTLPAEVFDGPPRRQAELAERWGLSAATVGEIIRRAVARLLGPGTVRATIDT